MLLLRAPIFILLTGAFLATPALARDISNDPLEADEALITQDDHDPWEPFNRQSFSLNLGLDQYILKPVAKGYRGLLPEMVRNSVSNIFENLSEPVNLVNGVLQLNPEKSFTAFWRFTLNSTFGFAGIRDFAGEQGLTYHQSTFGQTLDCYGTAAGPYFVVPLLGPSTLRDATGTVVDTFIDPFFYLIPTKPGIAMTAVEAVDARDQESVLIDELYYNAVEPYVAMRSAYLQHRSFQSRSGKEKTVY